jgi:hypothetical protein
MYSKYLENIFRGEEFPLMFSGYNSYNKIKGENDMFDASRIKLGDYVETRDGRIGYVTEVKPNGNTCFNWKMIDGTDMYTGILCPLNKCFKQIGTYKFDAEEKKDKCEIEKVKPKEKTDYGIKEISNFALATKINEIIDYLNKE